MKRTIFSPDKGKGTKKLKGFTLVELIVVMVILALLMALAIPQVTKYIDKAGEITMKSEARACYTALQAFCVEEYEANKTQGSSLQTAVYKDLTTSTTTIGVTSNYVTTSKILQMANIPSNGRIINLTIEGTTVKSFTYVYNENNSASKTQIEYANGKYSKKTIS